VPEATGLSQVFVRLLAGLRRSQVPLARTLVALFAISWLGLAVQPCAAMGHGHGQQDSGQAAHHDSQGVAGHDCPHCPPAPADDQDDCSTGIALDCTIAGIPVPSTQAVEQPRFDTWAIIDLPDFPALTLRPSELDSPTCEHAVWRPPSASIQQRFCTFLK
jgi:hypothetical protein